MTIPRIAPRKNAAAVALGKLGAKKGGLARWKNRTPEERRAHALMMVLARQVKIKRPSKEA